MLKVVTGAIATGFLAWLGSMESRIRGKVNGDTCNAHVKHMTTQLERIESHMWDMMKANNIKPSVPFPDGIINNNKGE